MTSHAMPVRGRAFGVYPQRQDVTDHPVLRDGLRLLRSRLQRPMAPELPQAVAQALKARPMVDDGAGLLQVRHALRREGFTGSAGGAALGVAARAMQRALGKAPYPTQLRAAWLMLDGHLVEMATGEGKTLAAALAAAVGALGGVPVHVLTANDYLVRRDRDALEPFFASLGLTVACVTGSMERSLRTAAWRADIVYTTAREVTFDYLRDHIALGGERDARVLRARALAAQDSGAIGDAGPALPGLCLCLIDEADSILLDEAVVPLILAAPMGGLDIEAYRRAYELSAVLHRQRDYTLEPAARAATLTDAGRERVGVAVKGAQGALFPARRACELVEAALAARICYKRDREYVVVADKLQLIDELTGRIAQGRQWRGALHPMVEIKEGLEPTPPTSTVAQITYQRFFPRYLHLGGMSGTLLEARHELRVLYDAPVVRLPLAQADRRRWIGEDLWVDAERKWLAVLDAVRSQRVGGRPVLVGTDSVGDAERISALLHSAGIAHQVLSATQDADEAGRVARAGVAGMVTVATNMAGRGTDIRLDAAAAACGGLHVVAAMRNRARRIDRQLIGRAARHGDPGSAQSIVALDDALLSRAWPAWLLKLAASAADNAGKVPASVAGPLLAGAQRLAEWRDQGHRRALRGADRQMTELYGFAGGTE